jgi:hypothetical protein
MNKNKLIIKKAEKKMNKMQLDIMTMFATYQSAFLSDIAKKAWAKRKAVAKAK